MAKRVGGCGERSKPIERIIGPGGQFVELTSGVGAKEPAVAWKTGVAACKVPIPVRALT